MQKRTIEPQPIQRFQYRQSQLRILLIGVVGKDVDGLLCSYVGNDRRDRLTNLQVYRLVCEIIPKRSQNPITVLQQCGVCEVSDILTPQLSDDYGGDLQPTRTDCALQCPLDDLY